MKYLYLSIIIFSFLSCGSNHNNASEPLVVEEVVADIAVSSPSEELEEGIEIDFNYFDDYANVLTKTDLVNIFGGDALTHKISWYAEGTVEKQTTILKDTINGYELTYVWNDDNDSLAWISADYSIWDGYEISSYQSLKTKNGLVLGMTLSEIQNWNGASFEFTGFGWDYAGGIFQEEGSRLSKSGFILTLSEGDDLDGEKYEFIMGDMGLNSDDEKLKGAGIHLGTISMYSSK